MKKILGLLLVLFIVGCAAPVEETSVEVVASGEIDTSSDPDELDAELDDLDSFDDLDADLEDVSFDDLDDLNLE